MEAPPSKKRRTDGEKWASRDAAWDCEDFTEADIAHMDHFVATQQSTQDRKNDSGVDRPNSGFSRLLGRGAARSLSETHLHSSHQSGRVERHVRVGPGVLPENREGPAVEAVRSNRCGGMADKTCCKKAISGTMSVDNDNNNSDLELKKLHDRLDRQKKELLELKEVYDRKDGEIKILRSSLGNKDAELQKQRHDKLVCFERSAKEVTENRNLHEKEIEKLRTQLQFKDNEISELQMQYKKLDLKIKTNSKATNGARADGQAEGYLSPQTPCETKQSMANNRSPKLKPASSHKTSVAAKAIQTSGNVPSDNTTGRFNRFRLTVARPRGAMCGPQLLSKLLAGRRWATRGTSHQHPARQQDTSPQSSKPQQSRAQAAEFLFPPGGYIPGLTYGMAEQELDQYQSWFGLAQQAIHGLLQLDGNRALHISNPMILDSSTKQSVLLLPAVEALLGRLINVKTCNADSSFTSGSTCSVAKGTSVDGTSLDFSESANLSNPDIQMVNLLQNLLVLVQNCKHVRKAILDMHTSVLFTGTEQQMNIGSRTERSSGALSVNTHEQNQTKVECALRSLDIPECRLFETLLKLADPLQCCQFAYRGEVCELALRILTSLIESSFEPDMDNLWALPSLCVCIQNCLMEDLDLGDYCQTRLATRSTDLLRVACRSPRMMQSLCTDRRGDCTLASLYNLGNQPPQPWTTSLRASVISLLSAILASHKRGFAALTEANCCCSVDLVKCLVLMLHQAFVSYRGESENVPREGADQGEGRLSGQTPSMLCRGLLLLHALGQKDRLFSHHHRDVDHQYVELVCGMEVLCREIGLEQGLAAAQDLWDFEHDFPDRGEESDHQPLSNTGTDSIMDRASPSMDT